MLPDWVVHFRANEEIRRVLPSPPQAFQGLGTGGDIQGGEVGVVGTGGEHRCDLGDGGIVAVDAGLRRVGDGRRQRGTEGVDELVVGVPGETEGGVGLEVVHPSSIRLE